MEKAHPGMERSHPHDGKKSSPKSHPVELARKSHSISIPEWKELIMEMEMTFDHDGKKSSPKSHPVELAGKSHSISIPEWEKLIMEMEMTFDHNGRIHPQKMTSSMMTFP